MNSGLKNGALKGRLIAIIILAVVSGASFALGYFVGQAGVPEGATQGLRPVARAEVRPAPTPPAPAVKTPPREAPAEPEEATITLRPAFTEKTVPEPERPARTVKRAAPAPPKTATTTRPTTTRPATETPYTVQAGVFSSRQNADKLRSRLTSIGFGAFVEGSGDRFVVKAGRFATRSAAADAVARLKRTEGIKAFVSGPQ